MRSNVGLTFVAQRSSSFDHSPGFCSSSCFSSCCCFVSSFSSCASSRGVSVCVSASLVGDLVGDVVSRFLLEHIAGAIGLPPGQHSVYISLYHRGKAGNSLTIFSFIPRFFSVFWPHEPPNFFSTASTPRSTKSLGGWPPAEEAELVLEFMVAGGMRGCVT